MTLVCLLDTKHKKDLNLKLDPSTLWLYMSLVVSSHHTDINWTCITNHGRVNTMALTDDFVHGRCLWNDVRGYKYTDQHNIIYVSTMHICMRNQWVRSSHALLEPTHHYYFSSFRIMLFPFTLYTKSNKCQICKCVLWKRKKRHYSNHKLINKHFTCESLISIMFFLYKVRTNIRISYK